MKLIIKNYCSRKNLSVIKLLFYILIILVIYSFKNENNNEIIVPFAGNSYVLEPANSNQIDFYSGKYDKWVDKNAKMASFFRVGKSGKLKIYVIARNLMGNSTLRFTVDGKSYDVKVIGTKNNTYKVATIYKEKPGYIKITMEGISKTGESYAIIDSFKIVGQAISGYNNFTKSDISKPDLNCYWSLRGASVHFSYTMPKEPVEYFYNEVRITKENAVRGSFYMVSGFGQGYMGLQVLSNGDRKVLFSVWSPYNTDNPNEVPDNERIKLLKKGNNVRVGEFGNEGSGGQSWLDYSWESGVTYKTLVRVKPDGEGNTIYTAYFFAENKWNLIASFLRPKTNTYYTRAHSFLENFDPRCGIYSRYGNFGNQWVYTTSGKWIELTEAVFSCDNTGEAGFRYDYGGYVDTISNTFVLQSFGFTDIHVDSRTMFRRKSDSTKQPNINFSTLE